MVTSAGGAPVRNRVVLARVSVALVVVAVALVTGATAASANAAEGVAASNMQFPIGPVGIAAAAFVAIFFFSAPFPLIVIAAGLIIRPSA